MKGINTLFCLKQLAKDISTNKLWRRISITNGRRGNDEADMVNIKLRKVIRVNTSIFILNKKQFRRICYC